MGELANAFSGLSDFVNTGVGIANKMMQDQAQMDILQMKANLEKNANQKLLDLQQRNDFENWGKEVDDFITKQGDAMQRASKNQYTAKLANEMITNWSGDFSNRVQIAALGKAQDNMRVTANNTIATIISDQGKKGQQCYDECNTIINTAESNGLITAAAADEQRKSAANQTAIKGMKDITDQYTDLIKTGRATPEEYMAAIDAYTPDLTITGRNGEVIPVDYKSAKESVKNQNATTMQASLKAFQKSNDDTVESIWKEADRAYAAGDYETCSTYVAKGHQLLDTLAKNPNSLEKDGLRKWENEFNNYSNKLTGSGGSSATEKYLDDILKYAPDNFTEKWYNGDFSDMSSARDACMLYVKNEAMKKYGSEDKADDYIAKNSAVFDGLVTKTAQTIWKQDFEGKGKYAAKFNAAIKNLDPEQKAYAAGWMLDQLVSYRGEIDPKTMSNNLDDLVSNLSAKKLDTMTLDKNGKTKFKITDDKSYAKAMLEVQSHDRVYTDTHGKEVWYGGEDAQKALTQAGGVVTETRNRVAEQLGVDPKNTTYRWKKTNNGTDVTNIPIVTVDGKDYEVKSDGKNYSIYQVEGDKEVKKIYGSADAKNAVKEAKNATNTFEENRQTTRQEEVMSIKFSAVVDKLGKKATRDLTPEQWDNMSSYEKVKWLEAKKYY